MVLAASGASSIIIPTQEVFGRACHLMIQAGSRALGVLGMAMLKIPLWTLEVIQLTAITTYFRRSFQLFNVDRFDGYEVLVRRDDGVAVYLNGHEVGRDNLVESADLTTLANVAIGGVDEVTPTLFSIDTDRISVGDNILTAEVHQSALGSSDLTFDLSLVGLVDAHPRNISWLPTGTKSAQRKLL